MEVAQDGLVAVTALPDWVIVALQPCVTCWLPGNDQVTLQPPEIASPRLVTVTWAVNPTFHEFAVYATRQPAAALALVATATPRPVTSVAAAAAVRPRMRTGLMWWLLETLRRRPRR